MLRIAPSIFVVGITVSASIARAGDPSPQGVWQLDRDDDSPGQKAPTETMSVFPDGRLLVQGKSAFQGRYVINGNQFVMFIDNAGVELAVTRAFDLKGGFLRFKNTKSGYAWYEKSDSPFPQWDPMEAWGVKEDGYFSYRLPSGWVEKKEAANNKGHQRLALMTSDASKFLIVVRVPLKAKPSGRILEKMLRAIVDESLPGKVGPTMQAMPTDGETLFGGNATIALQVPPTEGAIQVAAAAGAVDTKTAWMAVAVFKSDGLRVLPEVLRTLKIR